MKDHKILGVILAGGKSSRFGSNKSLSNLKNFKLIEHVIQKLNKKFDEILIVSNDSKLIFENKKINIIKDCIEGYLGPLAGVLSAIKYANNSKKYQWIMTFVCDTPFFDEIIIDQMIEKTTNTKLKKFLLKIKNKDIIYSELGLQV